VIAPLKDVPVDFDGRFETGSLWEGTRHATALSQLLRHAPHALTLIQFRSRPGRLVLPDVCCDLVWARGRVSIAGPMSRAGVTSNPGAEITVLRLDPLTTRAWLKTPLDLLTDQTVPLADIDKVSACAVEALYAEGKLATLVQPTATAFVDGIDARLAQAMASLRRGVTVARVANALSMSERQLERVFRRQLGLGPKLFSRIARFRRAVGAVKRGGALAASAEAAGYADQAHLSRETRALTGFSPTALMVNVGNVQDIRAGTM